MELYERSIRQNVRALAAMLGPDVRQRSVWSEIRRYYGERLENVPDAGFMKTFFNSISRRLFGTVGVDPDLEFVSPAPDEGIKSFEALSLRRYPYWQSLERPLNLYIRENTRDEALNAILDYGQTLKDLAHTNIFPGDLLLKNFGVTRHRRVVFYDYHEVALVTECHFRELPDPRPGEELMNHDTWLYVGEHDIFPEEFIKFLPLNGDLRQAFLDVHGDILTADYWRTIQAAHRAGSVPLVIPYQQFRRAALTA